MNPQNSTDHWNTIWKNEGLATWREYPWVFGEIAREVHDGNKVLEIGCGNGILASRVRDLRVVAYYDGIDISRDAIEQARLRLGEDTRYEFQVDDVTSDLSILTNTPNGRYDVCLASEILEHFTDEEFTDVLSHVSRIAKRLVAAVPNNTLKPNECAEHHQVFTKDTLHKKLLRYYPFIEIIETHELDEKNNIFLPVLIAKCSHKKQPEPRVLIAAPMGSLKDYSIGLWFEYIINQNHANYEVAVCCNNKDKHELASKFNETSWTDVHGQHKKPVVFIVDDDYDITLIQRLTYSREKLRQYAIDNNFDAVLWLDSDTIPPSKDAIQRLLSWDKEAVSGLYHYKKSYQPVIVSRETNSNASWEEVKHSVYQNKLHRISGCGFGCFLVKGRALRVPFDYYRKEETYSEDLSWNEEAENRGIEQWMDPVVLCKHFGKDDFAENEDKTFNNDRV